MEPEPKITEKVELSSEDTSKEKIQEVNDSILNKKFSHTEILKLLASFIALGIPWPFLKSAEYAVSCYSGCSQIIETLFKGMVIAYPVFVVYFIVVLLVVFVIKSYDTFLTVYSFVLKCAFFIVFSSLFFSLLYFFRTYCPKTLNFLHF